MHNDEFAFFNQQLGLMLREGIPLEGALRQLASGLKRSPLKDEIQLLEQDLARGTPLKDALAARKLPPLFVRLVELGARTNDLPGVLTLLADHYARVGLVWTRLKGLLVYPAIVVLVSLGLTVMVSLALGHALTFFYAQSVPIGGIWLVGLWMPPIFFGVLALALAAALYRPSWRGKLRWRLPAFREASLAQVASTVALMLKNGTPLPEALALAEQLESGTAAAPALAHWRKLIESGQGKPAQWTGSSAPFPPLFLWLVQQGGENPAAGFQKAAEMFSARANYRIELLLYGALPVSVLLLGQMVLWQVTPLMRSFIWMMNMLGDAGGAI